MSMSGFLDFLTAEPFSGCGYDPEQIEKLIKDDAEALTLYRKAVTAPAHRPPSSTEIVSTSKPGHGNSRAYTLARLRRDHPALYEAVQRGELSANAAAIKVDFCKKLTEYEQIVKWLPQLSDEERRQRKDLL
jgi:hypothetical protein